MGFKLDLVLGSELGLSSGDSILLCLPILWAVDNTSKLVKHMKEFAGFKKPHELLD